MKKIIVCIALSIVSILAAVTSFIANDIGHYRAWMADSAPRIMDKFDRGPKADKPDKHHDDHHDKQDRHDRKEERPGRNGDRPMKDGRMGPPPAAMPQGGPQNTPAPAQEQPAPSADAEK